MSPLANDDLLRRIEELETENTVLREQADTKSPSMAGPGDPVSAAPPRRKRTWGWTLLSTVLIVIGAIMAPMALAASWAKVTLTDTDQFVATYAPLAHDPQLQSYVTQQTLAVINQQVDIPQVTSEVIDGITALGTGPRATRALELLKGPAASGLESLVKTGVTNFVKSPAFADVWASALRVSHSQVVAALQNDPNAALTISSNGTIGIQLGPIVAAVKTALLAQGISLAAQIPAVNRTIPLAKSDALPQIQVAYGIVVSAGPWLAWAALLFLAAGVLVSRRRSHALIGAAVALAVAMAVTLAAFAIGSVALISTLSPKVPASVTGLLYETVAANMRATAISVLVLAVVVAIVGYFAGPFRFPRRLRALGTEAAGRIRDAGDRRGITTGRVGEWVYTYRALLRAIVAVIAAAVVLLVRPVTIELTLWTLVLAVLVVVILELVQRPVIPVPLGTAPGVPPVPVGAMPVGTAPAGTVSAGTVSAGTVPDTLPVPTNGEHGGAAAAEVPVVKAE